MLFDLSERTGPTWCSKGAEGYVRVVRGEKIDRGVDGDVREFIKINIKLPWKLPSPRRRNTRLKIECGSQRSGIAGGTIADHSCGIPPSLATWQYAQPPLASVPNQRVSPRNSIMLGTNRSPRQTTKANQQSQNGGQRKSGHRKCSSQTTTFTDPQKTAAQQAYPMCLADGRSRIP